MKSITDWFLQTDPLEITGIILSLIYLYFEIKAKVIMWFFGIISSAIMGWVFFQSGFYADMGLMIYYVIISFYGWIHWSKKDSQPTLPIINISKPLIGYSILIVMGCYSILLMILLKTPSIIGIKDSSFPYIDALTVSASIVATWLLSLKVIQQWHIWLVVNIISTVMFALKGLNYTTILYVIYAIGSWIGYRSWLKTLKEQNAPSC